jgi:hypothetical protein
VKKLIAVCMMLALCAGIASAQQYAGTQLGTNMVFAPNTTNTINGGAFTATKANDIGIKFAVTAAGTATDAPTATLMKSLDGSTYDAAPIATLQVSQVANTTAVQNTNLTLGAIGYVRLGTIINPSTNIITVIVTGYVKPTRLGN